MGLLVLEQNDNVNLCDGLKRTPLHVAASEGQVFKKSINRLNFTAVFDSFFKIKEYVSETFQYINGVMSLCEYTRLMQGIPRYQFMLIWIDHTQLFP